MRILHFLGGTSIDLAGNRAIAQTKMTISQRGLVEGVLCDVVCTGRFYDFLERRDGRWGIVLRQPIYEKDRLDPVDPAARLELSPATLARFRKATATWLTCPTTSVGYDVKADMPGLTGPEVDALYQRGTRWLAQAAPATRPAWPGRAYHHRSVDQYLVDKLAQLRADPVRAGREQLGEERHRQLLLRVDPERGAGGPAPGKLARRARPDGPPPDR